VRDREAEGGTGSGATSGRRRHLAVRQQEKSAMLSSAATSWGPDRELGMESHLAAGPIQWRFSPYAFNGG
jgi:hypothetical protein